MKSSAIERHSSTSIRDDAQKNPRSAEFCIKFHWFDNLFVFSNNSFFKKIRFRSSMLISGELLCDVCYHAPCLASQKESIKRFITKLCIDEKLRDKAAQVSILNNWLLMGIVHITGDGSSRLVSKYDFGNKPRNMLINILFCCLPTYLEVES